MKNKINNKTLKINEIMIISLIEKQLNGVNGKRFQAIINGIDVLDNQVILSLPIRKKHQFNNRCFKLIDVVKQSMKNLNIVTDIIHLNDIWSGNAYVKNYVIQTDIYTAHVQNRKRKVRAILKAI